MKTTAATTAAASARDRSTTSTAAHEERRRDAEGVRALPRRSSCRRTPSRASRSRPSLRRTSPNYAQNYPSCHWSPATVHDVHRQVPGPGVHEPRTSHQDHARHDVEQRPAARTPIARRRDCRRDREELREVIGVQWGMSDRAGRTLKSSRHLPIWLSEHKCGNYPGTRRDRAATTPAPNDFAYGVESWGYIRDCDQERRDGVQRLEHGARQGRQGIDTTRNWAAERAAGRSTAAKTLTRRRPTTSSATSRSTSHPGANGRRRRPAATPSRSRTPTAARRGHVQRGPAARKDYVRRSAARACRLSVPPAASPPSRNSPRSAPRRARRL